MTGIGHDSRAFLSHGTHMGQQHNSAMVNEHFRFESFEEYSRSIFQTT